MKKTQLFVFTVISLFFTISYASTDNPFNRPVPVQSFETSATVKETPKPAQAPQTSSDAAAMVKVKSIMKKSKQAVDSDMVSKSETIKPMVKSQALSAKTNSATVKELESQISELNQAELLYQQNTNQKVEALTSQNEAMQAKLTKLTEAMLMINQELSQVMPRGTSAASRMTLPASQHVESALNNSDTSSLGTWSQKIQARFHGATIYFAFAVVILLALLMAMLLRQNNNTKAAAIQIDEDTREEYDFMGSNEAIPAKLDLARTYMDMDDKPAARKVLDDVLQKGDQEQKKLASELLKKLQ